jgi:hypothetical protein
MKKQVKAVMLPTENKTSKIWLDNDIDELLFDPIGVMNCTPQHIYITSDDEIKEGDHVLSTAQDYNMQVVPKHSVKTYNDVEHYFKIIATSDFLLTKPKHEFSSEMERVPNVSQH